MNKNKKLLRDNLKLKAGIARGFRRPNKKIASLT
jgi:outer membrane receptor for ferrienterochelin and colicin